MKVPGLKTLKLSARWLRSRFVNGALILGYHRVAEAPHDPYGICVTPRHFAEQLETLHRYAHPMSLRELVKGARGGNLPQRAVALTFDDGYADNLYHAKPLLACYQIPATVFIVTGYLEREFWWDELERMVLSPAALPERLCLTVNHVKKEWLLDPVADINFRKRFLHSLCDFFRPLSEQQRQIGISQLRVWADTETNGQHRNRGLSPDELIELSADGLVDVGAHTVTHPILSNLSFSAQRSEIEESKASLEKILERPVYSFSYPNGRASSSTLIIIKEAGFDCACTSRNDIVWRRSGRFQLPRFWVPDWDGEAFSRWLQRWLK